MDDNSPEFLNNSIVEPGPAVNPAATFHGNNYDLVAVVGVTVAVIMLLSCASFGLAVYCLPLLPVILGVVGLVAAKESVNPERTKLLSWISIGIGGVVLLLILAIVALYAAFIGLAITNGGSSF